MSKVIKTTCPYCGVGCGVIAEQNDDGQFTIVGDPEHPANFGRLCSKGAALADTLSLEGRLLAPEIDGKVESWNTVLNTVASRFQTIIEEHGPESVAVQSDQYLPPKALFLKLYINTAHTTHLDQYLQ